MRRIAMALLFSCALMCGAEDWGPLQFLIGDWTGEGGGEPGQASAGAFSFAPDLQGKILVRKSFAEYPAANGRPAFRHDDLTIISRDPSGRLRATYWDNEGHMIQYAVQQAADGVTFVSEAQPGAPRYRLTYANAGKDRARIKFEIADPGKEFRSYVESSAKKH